MCAKDRKTFFYLKYPQIKEVGKSDQVVSAARETRNESDRMKVRMHPRERNIEIMTKQIEANEVLL